MKSRKSISVESIKERVNIYCKTDKISQEEKKGACSILEHVLESTGNYHGYKQVPKETDTFGVWDRNREWDRFYF